MSPTLDRGRWVFCEVEMVPDGLEPVVLLRERGKWTVVVEETEAEARGWSHDLVTAMVEIAVDVTPGSPGLIGPALAALSSRGIGARVVSGPRVDRLFVPHDRGWDTLDALEQLRDQMTGTDFR